MNGFQTGARIGSNARKTDPCERGSDTRVDLRDEVDGYSLYDWSKGLEPGD